MLAASEGLRREPRLLSARFYPMLCNYEILLLLFCVLPIDPFELADACWGTWLSARRFCVLYLSKVVWMCWLILPLSFRPFWKSF